VHEVTPAPPSPAGASPAPATAAWSRYWATGAPHSCAGSFEQAYGGAIGAFWREAFAWLPADARVLDLACGNGALARLLVGARADAGLRCDAVDLADVAPAWARSDRRLHFHARTAAEALPFPDACFDLVASQFGIEYADLSRAFPEALRVARPNGLVHLVVHHRDGRPCTLAREELAHVAWLTEAGGWFDAASAMLEPLSLLAAPDGRARLAAEPRFAHVRQAFDDLVAQARARRAASVCGDLLDDVQEWTAQAFRAAGTQGRAEGAAALSHVRSTVDDVHARLQDLLGHALDDEAVRALAATARRLGWALRHAALHDRGHLMAVALSLHRA